MKCVRVIEPDIEKGGRIVGGAIVGASKRVKTWTVNEVHYKDRTEARKVELLSECNRKLFDALQLNLRFSITKPDVIPLIREHGEALRAVLQDKRFAFIFNKAAKVEVSS